MSERDDPTTRPGRQPAEGVRIIKAEEAQAALDAGEAAGRRPDDQLRFGDVPPAPSGPRPVHRFPLPDSVDPAEAVALPPLASRAGEHFRSAEPPGPAEPQGPADNPRASEHPKPAQTDPTEALSPADPGPAPDADPSVPASGPPTSVEPAPHGGSPPSGDPGSPPAAGQAASLAAGGPQPPPRYTPPPAESGHAGHETVTGGEDELEADAPPWAAPAGSFAAASDSTTELSPGIPPEGITVSGAPPEMPHWSDPPTGEVPRLRLDDDDGVDPEDLEAWRALGARGVRWRDENGWDEGDQLSDLAHDGDVSGALDQNRTEHSDLYSFDEDFERVTSRTGSHPVVDLTGADVSEVDTDDDEWAQIDTGAPSPAARSTRSGRTWRRDRGRRGAAEAGLAAGAAGAAVGAAAGGGAAGTGAAAAAAGAARASRPGPPSRPAPRPEPGQGRIRGRVSPTSDRRMHRPPAAAGPPRRPARRSRPSGPIGPPPVRASGPRPVPDATRWAVGW